VGDAASDPIRFSFNLQLRVEFRGATVASDAGLLLPRELDEPGLAADRVMRRWSATAASSTRPLRGTARAA
jgi:hypothetical protein